MPLEADLDRFPEAEEELAGRVPMTRDEWEQLGVASRVNAFTVASLEQLAMVQFVAESLVEAMATGQTFDDWANVMRVTLPQLPERRLGVVYRNAIQSAYNRGRYRQMRNPAVLKARPYWLYDAVLDSRTTSVCSSLNGVVQPADSEYWQTRIPPLHHQCRSSIRTLSERQAGKRSRFGEAPPDTQPAKGFGLAPGFDATIADASKYESSLWAYHQAKIDAIRAKAAEEARVARMTP